MPERSDAELTNTLLTQSTNRLIKYLRRQAFLFPPVWHEKPLLCPNDPRVLDEFPESNA